MKINEITTAATATTTTTTTNNNKQQTTTTTTTTATAIKTKLSEPLENWLLSVGLQRYKEGFKSEGYNSLTKIMFLEKEETEKMFKALKMKTGSQQKFKSN